MFIAVVVAIGMIVTFLPWASMAGFGSISGTNSEFGVWFTLILFGAGGGLAFFYGDKSKPLGQKMMKVAWITAGAALIIVLRNIFRDFGPASRGFGLWLALLAGLAQLAVCLFFKGNAGRDLPNSLDNVKKATGLPAASAAAPKAAPEPAAPAAPESAPEAPAEEPAEEPKDVE